MGSIISQSLVVGVIIAIGGVLWSQKPFWSKGLGAIAFVSAAVQLLKSPGLLAVASVLIVVTMAIRAALRRRKKQREYQDERNRAVNIHVHR